MFGKLISGVYEVPPQRIRRAAVTSAESASLHVGPAGLLALEIRGEEIAPHGRHDVTWQRRSPYRTDRI